MTIVRNLTFSRRSWQLMFVAMLTAGVSQADSIFLGFNTATPVQLYSTDGAYQQDLGPTGATAGVPLAAGNYAIIQPNSDFTTTSVTIFSSGFATNFVVNGLIDDGAPGPGNTLWLAAYDGTISQVSLSGSVLKSWTAPYTHIGIASDGTSLYTTQGDNGSHLNKWSMTGTDEGTLAGPLTGLYGLGFDASTGNFWAGSTNFVYEFNTSGAILKSLDIPGDSRTPNGAVHDGLELGSLAPPVTVPEPASAWLLLAAFGLLGARFLKRSHLKRVAQLGLAAVASVGVSLGAIGVSLSPSTPGSAPVGSTVTWTANASGSGLRYQFAVGPLGGALQIVRDYSSVNTFPWTPSDHEGTYTIQVKVKSSTDSGLAIENYVITSRATGSSPVVSHTNNPLVALYSMPPCPSGRNARVRFRAPDETIWQSTPFKKCNGTTSLNFYIAGMRASTTYTLQQDVYNGPFDTIGPLESFTTGAIPSSVVLPASSTPLAASAPNKTTYPVLLVSPIGGPTAYATDLQGRVIWYAAVFQSGLLTRPVPGGTVLGFFRDDSGVFRDLRELDLAGNLVRETNTIVLSDQLKARGTDPVTTISHEVIRFANGDTALLATVEKVADQGAGPVDVLGDMIIVLDPNLQVKWSWNAFDHLNVKRPAILGETCRTGQGGCPPIFTPGFTVANDWTHANSVTLAPDGNLILSMRHQDWVVKINYQNGAGSGSILWTLGRDGSFRTASGDPFPWPSHQHDAEFEPNGLLSLFDNGNTRVAEQGGGNSRGQAWQIDEANKVANPVVNLNLGDFSLATGSAQLLSNGNYHFYLGVITNHSKSEEYNTSNVRQFEQDLPTTTGYRTFRMRSLYSID